MRRAGKRRRAAAAALAAAVPLLGGCGIPETDAIEAGGPASFQAFLNRDYDMLLFFRSPDGALYPVIRTTRPSTEVGNGYVESGSEGQDSGDPAGPVPTEKVVSALLSGPRQEDRAVGLDTALPPARGGGTVEVKSLPDGTVTTRLPLALQGLDSTALRQLTCTIAYSQAPNGQIAVELTGLDGTRSSGTCGLALGSAGSTPAVTASESRPTPSPTGG